jgi:hypothetical protein
VATEGVSKRSHELVTQAMPVWIKLREIERGSGDRREKTDPI